MAAQKNARHLRNALHIEAEQHLAIVAAYGVGLVVNLMRWSEEVRDMKGLTLPGDAAESGVTEKELMMGEQLDMT